MSKLVANSSKTMRADARKNYEQLLEVARTAIEQDGAGTSLRDIARKAGVGLGTLYRHFPTRGALLETLLRGAWEELNFKSRSLQAAENPDEALVSWLGDFVEVTRMYRGLVYEMADAYADENSALHASCLATRASAAALLARAQMQGTARRDINETDVFALVGALAWISEQPSLEGRANHMFDLMTSSIFKR